MGIFGQAKEDYQKPCPKWAGKTGSSNNYAIYGHMWGGEREKLQQPHPEREGQGIEFQPVCPT